jgi:hypothetical protein
MARRKPTIKELEAKVEDLTRINNQVTGMLDTFGNVIKFYIDFKGDTEDFQQYYTKKVEKIREKILKGANNE